MQHCNVMQRLTSGYLRTCGVLCGRRVCVCVRLRMCVCMCVCGGLGQEWSMLAFIIRVQGSPLASVISQICPKAARQAEKEEGGNERTDGNSAMPRSQLT